MKRRAVILVHQGMLTQRRLFSFFSFLMCRSTEGVVNMLYEDLFSQGKLFPPTEAMCQIQVPQPFSCLITALQAFTPLPRCCMVKASFSRVRWPCDISSTMLNHHAFKYLQALLIVLYSLKGPMYRASSSAAFCQYSSSVA